MSLTGLEERRIEDESWPELTLAATSLVIFCHLFGDILPPPWWYFATSLVIFCNLFADISLLKSWYLRPWTISHKNRQVASNNITCNGGESCCGISKGGFYFEFPCIVICIWFFFRIIVKGSFYFEFPCIIVLFWFCGAFKNPLLVNHFWEDFGGNLRFNSGFSECSEGSGDCDQDSDCMGSLVSIWYLVFQQILCWRYTYLVITINQTYKRTEQNLYVTLHYVKWGALFSEEAF